jgi:hypothetical protein
MVHITPLRFLCYNFIYLLWLSHLCYSSLLKPLKYITTISMLSSILSWWKSVRMTIVVPLVRFQYCAPYWIEWLVIKLMRTLIWDRETKLRASKWSIIRWEDWEWIRRYSGLRGGSPHLGRLRTVSCWTIRNKHWLVLMRGWILIFWEVEVSRLMKISTLMKKALNRTSNPCNHYTTAPFVINPCDTN